MRKMGLNEIRERYLEFFESKGHLRHKSFSLIPVNDKSLLLINSGMAPLKPYFTGQEEPPRKRMTTCQKCIRTPDIDNVGITARHGTFFEMLGNFSFGDYFKEEAIKWGWEFVTKVMELPEDRLWISVYLDDDEARDIWIKNGVSPDRIVKMGKEDNFWEHGTGPCGPCSEIYYDRGIEHGCGKPDCGVGCECDRFIEFWNLVFTQFNKDENGNYSKLANPNIDTGMGLERLACIMQDVDNLFEVDTVRNILDKVCELAGVKYKENSNTDVSIRVITDHIRSTVMMISDGVLPSNEGRGYVLRRLLRRAARHGKLLGINKLFLSELADVVINESGDAYPELKEKSGYIKKVIETEEEKFNVTIDQGTRMLEDFLEDIKKKGGKELNGDMIFKLHDTYGFPFDLTKEIAAENGISVDEKGFKELMLDQKQKARDAIKDRAGSWGNDFNIDGIDKSIKTEFIGYTDLCSESKVLYIIKDGQLADSACEGEMISIVLDKTPFYAESGGQIGDTGLIYDKSKSVEVKVTDVKKTQDGKYIHISDVIQGTLNKDDEVTASVDSERRAATARNHTATHLLQKALKIVLGDHVHQAGSSVDGDRLRFDFTHFQAVSKDELDRVEEIVNNSIYESMSVKTEEMPIDEAKKRGAMALFGEKYGNVVRLVSVGDFSLELCGGTHVSNSSQIGLVKIVSESGVAAGVRRIEAITGLTAIRYYKNEKAILDSVSEAVKSTPNNILNKIEQMNAELKASSKEIADLKAKIAGASFDELMSNVKDVKGVKVLTGSYDNLAADELRDTGDKLRDRLGENAFVLLVSVLGSDKVNLVAMADKGAVTKGVNSGSVIREISKMLGGGGGGRPDMAQAGGRDASRVEDALKHVYAVVENMIS